MDKQNTEAETDGWFVPLRIKAAVTFFTLSGGAVLVLSLLREQETIFGLSAQLVTGLTLGLFLLSLPLALVFWFFPRNPFALFLYWLFRFFREQICIFALLGMVYLITIRATPISVRGGIPAISLILLFLIALSVQPIELDRFPLPWMQKLSVRLEAFIRRINTLPIWPLRVAIALLPIAVVFGMIYVGMNASLADYRPYSSWEDETAYWLRVRSFSHVGLDAGYNSPNELIAQAGFSHYGEGSPLYIYLYGSIARLVGWSPQLPILINLGLLALAIFGFTCAAKLDPLQILFTGLIAVLTWPVLSYLPMTTHETLNQAIGFILAIVFLKLLVNREQVRWPIKASFIALVYLAALVRLSWGLLLVPVIFYCLDGPIIRRLSFAVFLGLGLYISATLIMSYLVPPVNNSIFLTLKESLVRGPQVFGERIADQLSQMLRFRTLSANIAVMFQIAVIIGWSAIRLIRSIKAKLSTTAILYSQAVFDMYNVGTLALTGLIFYLQSGFSRTFAPSVLLVYLLQIVRKDYKFLATLLALNIVFFVSYMGESSGALRIVRADFTSEFPERASLQAEIEKWIVFDPTASSPWCNTLLVPLQFYDRRLTLIPPGIGVSFIADNWDIHMPLKSKYLLFDQKTYEQFEDHLHVRLLESFSLGDLYHNLDSGCELKQ